jgi:hypothetical protein
MFQPKHRYKTTLNWQGEIHTFYCWANRSTVAKSFAIYKLSKRIDRSIKFLSNYYNGVKDNYKVEEVKDEKRPTDSISNNQQTRKGTS